MFRKAATIFAIVAAMLVAPNATRAQDSVAQWTKFIQGSCGKEMKSLCAGVKQGQGRILSCLYAREDRLSAKCGQAVLGSLDRLGAALGALANAKRICAADADRLCNGVVAGDGNLVGCLAKARTAVSKECNATLDAAFLRP